VPRDPTPESGAARYTRGVREQGCVVVFTKPALPGRVKTRLIGALSADQTAELHQAFLDDLVSRLRPQPHAVWLAWALEEGEEAPPSDLPALRQEGSDLGARLFKALDAASREFTRVAAVGSDHPELPAERVDEAFARLEGGADVVLGPASDGGYYLIAVGRKGLRREVFQGIEWSTESVLASTIANCRSLGLAVALLEPGHDVDTPEDLPRLGAYLTQNPDSCPRTLDLFQLWGLTEAG